MPFCNVSNLASPTGARLATRYQPAEGNARAILLIEHGLAEHSGRYEDFARFMARRGFHVHAHDHRGHGRTFAPDAPQGVFAASGGLEAVLADCLAVREHAAEMNPGLPVVVFGHSMGGLIALNFAEAHPDRLDALAVWNSNFDAGPAIFAAGAILAVERMFLGSDVPSRMLPRLTFEAWARAVPERRSSADWLSSRPEEVDIYLADPLCGFMPSVSMWRDVLDLIRRGGSVDALRRLPKSLPVHMVGGGADPSTAGGQAVRRLAERARRAGLVDVTLRIRDHFRHETLREVEAESTMAEFAVWAHHAVRRDA